jgi:adenylate cyclase
VTDGALRQRLTAILAADAAGYSRLMAADERATVAALDAARALFREQIEGHQGRVIDMAGDSVLAIFETASGAVAASLAIQQKLDSASNEVPEARRMRFRIGVHLGDVIEKADGTIYGDGVNIAARLQGLSDPGGVSVSEAIRGAVKGKVAATFEDQGEQTVKNIAEPLRAYRAKAGSTDASASKHSAAEIDLSLPDKPSIAVLPFNNMSGDLEQEYFTDGITEDIITELSRFRSLFVIARNSSFSYKGKSPDIRQVGKELGVRYVLEGSIRRADNRIRVTAQLVDATTGRHVWAERYDREIEDIFELQDEMTQTIVAAVEPELGAFERERALRKPPQSLDAWETYQRGLWHMWSFTKKDNATALPLLRRAREFDPNFAAAYAYEGYSHLLNVILGYTDAPGESLMAALAAAKKAATLDDKEPAAFLTMGRVHMMKGEHDTSIAELEKSLSLNPNFAAAYFALGFTLTFAGRHDEALDALDNAMRLNPRDPLMWAIKTICSLTHNLLHKYDVAAEWARQAIREPRATSFWPYAALASALGNLNQIGEARTAIDQAQQQKPDLSLSYLEKTLPTKQPGELQIYLDGLRKAGLPE